MRQRYFLGSHVLFSLSLQDVLMQDSRLYLIFEFLSMDLKKYLDSIPPGQFMDSSLVKVKIYILLLIRYECRAHPCVLWVMLENL